VAKIRRAGYILVSWKGDHSPRHVHVYRDGEFVLKWDLEAQRLMSGTATRRVVRIIEELEEEGFL
jgi:hypothetical protein